MKTLFILSTFLLINTVYSQECTIISVDNNPNTNKITNKGCYKNGKYCENIFDICSHEFYAANGSIKEIGGIEGIDISIDIGGNSFKNVTKCNIELEHYNHRAEKEILINENFVCSENIEERKSCYQLCKEEKKADITCCVKCFHSSNC